jgi:hypothetical protein
LNWWNNKKNPHKPFRIHADDWGKVKLFLLATAHEGPDPGAHSAEEVLAAVDYHPTAIVVSAVVGWLWLSGVSVTT